MKHFSHPHDLKVTLAPEDNTTIQCFGCTLPLIGTCYTCSDCNFFLHRFCFELPKSAQFHCTHYEHTLDLVYPPYVQETTCDSCGESCNGFVYNCNLCKYNVHANCANLMDPNDPENDHDMYMTLFFAQKMGVINSLRNELRLIRAEKLTEKKEKHKMGVINSLKNELRSIKGEKTEKQEKQNMGVVNSLINELRSISTGEKREKNDDAEKEIAYIREMEMENELSRMRQDMYMQRMKQYEDSIDRMGQIDSSSKIEYRYRYY